MESKLNPLSAMNNANIVLPDRRLNESHAMLPREVYTILAVSFRCERTSLSAA